MNTRKILSLVVALAMLVTVVPAFGLVASAAEVTDELLVDYVKASESPLFDATNPAPAATNDTAVEVAYPNSGITATIASGQNLNVNSGPRFQSYNGSYTNGVVEPNYLNLPDYGTGNDSILVSFVLEYTCEWGDVALFDANDNLLTAFRYGLSSNANAFNVEWGHTGWGTPYDFSSKNYAVAYNADVLNGENSYLGTASGSTTCDVLLRNYEDSYTVSIYLNGTHYATVTYTGETFNGLGRIGLARGSGGSWSRISMQALKIYALDAPEQLITATYMVDGAPVDTVTMAYDAAAGGAVFPANYYSADGSNVIYGYEETTITEDSELTMTVVPNTGDYEIGDNIAVGDTAYEIVSGNLIPNGDFTYGLAGWLNGAGASAEGAFTLNGDGTVSSIYNDGNDGNGCLYRSWAIEDGKTYLFTYTDDFASGEPVYRQFSLSNSLGTDQAVNVIATSTPDTLQTVFTNNDNYDYAKIRFRWNGNVLRFGNFGLYEVQEAQDVSATVTVNYYFDEAKTDLYTTVQKTVIKGETASFDAVEASKDGDFYKADALSYENVTENASYDVVMTIDESKIKTSSNFSYNFTTGDVIWAGDNGFDSTQQTGSISIGWNNFRQTIMTFPIPTYTGAVVTGATLNVDIGFTSPATAGYTIYAIDPAYVDVANGTMQNITLGSTWDTQQTVLNEMGAVQVGYQAVSTGARAIELDLSNITVGDTLALLILSNNQVYTHTATTDTPPYISDIETEIVVSAPTLTAELGWNEGSFAIDFVTGNVDFTTGYTYGVDFYAENSSEAFASQTVTAEAPNAGISTDKTNLIYAARPWVQITGQAEKILGTPVYTSIYALVTEDIEASAYTAETEFSEDRIAAAVDVINAGGIFVDETTGTLTDEMLNIVEDNGEGGFVLTDSAKAVGITFNGEYDTITIVDGEAQLSNSEATTEAAAEELFVLEEVELVYVPELVEESVVNEQVEVEIDFEEIL